MVKRVSLGEWVDASQRLRVSTPGNDVDSQSLTDDQIAFDSGRESELFLIAAGTFLIEVSAATEAGSGPNRDEIIDLVTWPALSFVPFVRLYQRWETAAPNKFYNPVGRNFMMRVRDDRIQGAWDVFTDPGGTTFSYFVFNRGA